MRCIGNLLVYTGDPDGAAGAYDDALALVPAHAPSLAGKARLAVGAGDLDRRHRPVPRAADIVPLPEYVIGLGEAQAAAGRTDDADRSFKLARAEIDLFQATAASASTSTSPCSRRTTATRRARSRSPRRPTRRRRPSVPRTPSAGRCTGWDATRRPNGDRTRRSASGRRTRSSTITPEPSRPPSVTPGVPASELELALTTDPGFSATGAAEAARILDRLP